MSGLSTRELAFRTPGYSSSRPHHGGGRLTGSLPLNRRAITRPAPREGWVPVRGQRPTGPALTRLNWSMRPSICGVLCGLTGKPGTGKSTLAYSVARELQLGPVLSGQSPAGLLSMRGCTATMRSPGCRMRASRESGGEVTRDIGRYIRRVSSGPRCCLTVFPAYFSSMSLIVADIDLPNDLLTTFEDGEYEIPELARIAEINMHRDRLPRPCREPEAYQCSYL